MTDTARQKSASKQNLLPALLANLGCVIAICAGLTISAPLHAQIPGATITPLFVQGAGAVPRITAGPDGKIWFIDEGRKVVGTLSISGSTATQTTYPILPKLPPGQPLLGFARAIAAGPDAVWFVVQGCTSLSCINSTADLGKITADGTMTIVPITGANNPAGGMVVAPDGNIWYTDNANKALIRVTPQGTATLFSTHGNPTQWLVAGPDNAIWFSELGFIGRMTTGGSLTEFPVTGAGALAFGSDGNVWYSAATDQVGRLTPSGQQTLYPLPEKAYIGGLANGPDGAIWFTEHFDPKIGRIDVATGTAAIQPFNGFGTGGDIVPVSVAKLSSSRAADLDVIDGLIATFSDFSGGGELVKVETKPAEPDLTIGKAHVYKPNNNIVGITYQFRVQNIGNAPTKGEIRIDDFLPVGIGDPKVLDLGMRTNEGCDIVDDDARHFVCTTNIVLKPGEGIIYEVWGPVTAADGTTINNRATVAGGGETNTSNDTSNLDTFTTGKPAIEITKTHTGDPFLGTFQWLIKVKNTSQYPTTDKLKIEDDLPPGVTLKPFGDLIGASCNLLNGGASVACFTDGPLGPGKSLTIPLEVANMPRDAPVDNTAVVSGGGIDPTKSQIDHAGPRVSQPLTNQNPQPTTGRH